MRPFGRYWMIFRCQCCFGCCFCQDCCYWRGCCGWVFWVLSEYCHQRALFRTPVLVWRKVRLQWRWLWWIPFPCWRMPTGCFIFLEGLSLYDGCWVFFRYILPSWLPPFWPILFWSLPFFLPFWDSSCYCFAEICRWGDGTCAPSSRGTWSSSCRWDIWRVRLIRFC